MTPQERLLRIDQELAADQALQISSFTWSTASSQRKFKLLADGDSWFDYPLGKDVLDYLNNYFLHPVTKLAKAGSTLNELVYGPNELLLSDPQQGTTRLTRVIKKLREQSFDAFLFSGGGNDIAGPEFFSFLNHAASELPNPNKDVLEGVVNGTFKKAYEDLIEILQTEAARLKIKLPIFIHSYDYPWPDGRGAVALGVSGPWFEESFSKKGYPRKSHNELLARRQIVAKFIDALNVMQDGLVAKYTNVFKVDLKGVLPDIGDWANELHPTNDGFAKVAKKFNDRLYEVIGNI